VICNVTVTLFGSHWPSSFMSGAFSNTTPVPDMTYNVFGGALSLTQSI